MVRAVNKENSIVPDAIDTYMVVHFIYCTYHRMQVLVAFSGMWYILINNLKTQKQGPTCIKRFMLWKMISKQLHRKM